MTKQTVTAYIAEAERDSSTAWQYFCNRLDHRAKRILRDMVRKGFLKTSSEPEELFADDSEWQLASAWEQRNTTFVDITFVDFRKKQFLPLDTEEFFEKEMPAVTPKVQPRMNFLKDGEAGMIAMVRGQWESCNVYVQYRNMAYLMEGESDVIRLYDAQDQLITETRRLNELYAEYRKTLWHDYIIAGPPGTGKSTYVQKTLREALLATDEEQVERFLMTGASMHEDLWGAYKPVKVTVKKTDETTGTETVEDVIRYAFVPGPFARLLAKAYHSPDTTYVMILEELNRGNAGDVLGDLLQLLDRHPETGASQYTISLQETVKSYFEEQAPNTDLSGGLYLPSNLFLICTMNNSDAGVQAIDMAVRRRFAMIYLNIDGTVFGGDMVEDGERVVWRSTDDSFVLSEAEALAFIRSGWEESRYAVTRYYFEKYSRRNESGEKVIAGLDVLLNGYSYKVSLDKTAESLNEKLLAYTACASDEEKKTFFGME